MKTYSEKEINAFLFGRDNQEIAEELQKSVRTIQRMKKDEQLRALINERRADVMRTQLNRITALMEKCVDELETILNDAEIKPQIKINAMNLLFTQFREINMQIEIQERLDKIESAINRDNM